MDFPPAGVSLATARPDEAAEAAIKAVNAAGGVKGHPLVLSVCDSKGNGNVANACARAAVSNGTVADIGGFSFVGTPMEIMNAGKLPMIGRTPGFNPKEYSFPTVFPYFGVALTGMSAAVYAAVKFEHATKIALITSPPANAFTSRPAWQRPRCSVRRSRDDQRDPGLGPHFSGTQGEAEWTQAIAEITPIADQVIVAARQNGSRCRSCPRSSRRRSSGGFGRRGVYSIEPFQLPTASDPGLQQMQKEFNHTHQTSRRRCSRFLGGWRSTCSPTLPTSCRACTRASVLAAFQNLTNQYAYDLIPPYTTSVQFKGLGGAFPSLYNPSLYLQQVKSGRSYS